jgi:hypothetical protein
MQNKMFSEGKRFRINNSIFIHQEWIKNGDKATLNNLTNNDPADNDKIKHDIILSPEDIKKSTCV